MKGVLGGGRVRFDPWAADYGASLLAGEESEAWSLKKVSVDTSVELQESDWRPIPSPAAWPDGAGVAFVDGVRRIEANLVFEQDAAIQFGAFGCCAAGAVVLVPGRMNPMDQALKVCSVRRYLLVPEDSATEERIDLPLPYPPGAVSPHEIIPVSGNDPQEPLRRLQQLMRQEEALVAEQVTAEDASIVIADGPLSLPLIRSGIVGYIKSLHSLYLPPDLFQVLASLKKQERTPLFLLSGEDVIERYSSYVRIHEPGPQDTVLAGIVRLEVAGGGGMDEAKELLDRCAAVIPRFASPYGRDPRAPQNLLPVGALESELRRRLGNPEILKRLYRQVLSSQEAL